MNVEQELQDGKIIAEQLARHLLEMGAQTACTPVTYKGITFEITIKRIGPIIGNYDLEA